MPPLPPRSQPSPPCRPRPSQPGEKLPQDFQAEPVQHGSTAPAPLASTPLAQLGPTPGDVRQGETSVSALPLTRRSQICRSRSASPSKAERSFMAARIFRPRIIDGEACEARARAGVSRQREQLERGPVDSGVIEDLIEASKLSGPRSRKQSLGSCSSEARHSLSPLAGRGALGLVPRRHGWSVAPARLAGCPARVFDASVRDAIQQMENLAPRRSSMTYIRGQRPP